jgi:uncharacterized protein YjbI with pentapeptide repeats
LIAADLSGADLSRASLYEANFSGANLSGADLRAAKEWNEEQLVQARSLEDAAMPDGQTLRSNKTPNNPTFEDWLKIRGEDGENSGPS